MSNHEFGMQSICPDQNYFSMTFVNVVKKYLPLP